MCVFLEGWGRGVKLDMVPAAGDHRNLADIIDYILVYEHVISRYNPKKREQRNRLSTASPREINSSMEDPIAIFGHYVHGLDIIIFCFGPELKSVIKL